MRAMTKQWVSKAEGDFGVAERPSRSRGRAFDCHTCFHAYECADKYLKAILAENGVRFRFAMPLIDAYARVLGILPEWSRYRKPAEWLNKFDDSILYPGRTANRRQAQAAVNHCRLIREAARRELALPTATARRAKAGRRSAARSRSRERKHP